jgi:transposase
MYTCILRQEGEIVLHRNLKTRPKDFLDALRPFREQDLVVGIESTYNWYWLADLCHQENIPFVLGHALAMKAIHGGKTKNDKQDSLMIAMLLRGGNLPRAYVYPKATRAQRDLARRRGYFVRQRAELQTHIRNTASQYNLPTPTGQLRYACNQAGLAETFPNPAARLTIESDISMVNALTQQINQIEQRLLQLARIDDAGTFYRLKSVTGIGDILALVILYEVGDIKRFPTAGDFLSYSRLVPGKHESAGKQYGSPGRRQGNPHLKWAFSEAVSLMLRDGTLIKEAFPAWEKRYGRPKALSILAARLGRAVYLILTRGDVFDEAKFLQFSQDEATAVIENTPPARRRQKKNTSRERKLQKQTA